jgi:hypothetical protein
LRREGGRAGAMIIATGIIHDGGLMSGNTGDDEIEAERRDSVSICMMII